MNLKYRLLLVFTNSPFKIKDKYFIYNKISMKYFSLFIFLFFTPVYYIVSATYFFTVINYFNFKDLYITLFFFIFVYGIFFFILKYLWRFFTPIEEMSKEKYLEELSLIQNNKRLKNKKIIKFAKNIPIFIVAIYLLIFFIDIFKFPDFKDSKGYYTYSKNKEYMGVKVSPPNGKSYAMLVREKDNTILAVEYLTEYSTIYGYLVWFDYIIEKKTINNKRYIPISFQPAMYMDKIKIPVPLTDRVYAWLVVHIKGLDISDLELIDKATTKW